MHAISSDSTLKLPCRWLALSNLELWHCRKLSRAYISVFETMHQCNNHGCAADLSRLSVDFCCLSEAQPMKRRRILLQGLLGCKLRTVLNAVFGRVRCFTWQVFVYCSFWLEARVESWSWAAPRGAWSGAWKTRRCNRWRKWWWIRWMTCFEGAWKLIVPSFLESLLQRVSRKSFFNFWFVKWGEGNVISGGLSVLLSQPLEATYCPKTSSKNICGPCNRLPMLLHPSRFTIALCMQFCKQSCRKKLKANYGFWRTIWKYSCSSSLSSSRQILLQFVVHMISQVSFKHISNFWRALFWLIHQCLATKKGRVAKSNFQVFSQGMFAKFGARLELAWRLMGMALVIRSSGLCGCRCRLESLLCSQPCNPLKMVKMTLPNHGVFLKLGSH